MWKLASTWISLPTSWPALSSPWLLEVFMISDLTILTIAVTFVVFVGLNVTFSVLIWVQWVTLFHWEWRVPRGRNWMFLYWEPKSEWYKSRHVLLRLLILWNPMRVQSPHCLIYVPIMFLVTSRIILFPPKQFIWCKDCLLPNRKVQRQFRITSTLFMEPHALPASRYSLPLLLSLCFSSILSFSLSLSLTFCHSLSLILF